MRADPFDGGRKEKEKATHVRRPGWERRLFSFDTPMMGRQNGWRWRPRAECTQMGQRFRMKLSRRRPRPSVRHDKKRSGLSDRGCRQRTRPPRRPHRPSRRPPDRRLVLLRRRRRHREGGSVLCQEGARGLRVVVPRPPPCGNVGLTQHDVDAFAVDEQRDPVAHLLDRIDAAPFQETSLGRRAGHVRRLYPKAIVGAGVRIQAHCPFSFCCCCSRCMAPCLWEFPLATRLSLSLGVGVGLARSLFFLNASVARSLAVALSSFWSGQWSSSRALLIG